MGRVVAIPKVGLGGFRDRVKFRVQIFHQKKLPLVRARLCELAQSRERAVECLFHVSTRNAQLAGDLAKSRAALPKFENSFALIFDRHQLSFGHGVASVSDRGSLGASAQASPLPAVQSSRGLSAPSSSA